MTTQTQTLAEFLLARIGEDETAARVFVPDVGKWGDNEGRWSAVRQKSGAQVRSGVGSYAGTAVPVLRGSEAATMFAARFDPSRVLAECEAKRRIVALHSQEYPHRMYGCKTCREWEEPDWPCSTLRLLAQPYADHEAFKKEWRGGLG